MILDKEIQVNITSVNLKYYRNLEYDVKVGDKIKINVMDLPKNSGLIVNVKCDLCDNISKMRLQCYNYSISKFTYYKCQNHRNLLSKYLIFDKETELEIIELYNSGMKSKELIEKFNISCRTQLHRILKRGGRDKLRKKYTCNESFFEKIDSENKAYWLGFLFADGYVRQRGNSFNIELKLASKDKEHLLKFKNDIECTYEVKDSIIEKVYKDKKVFYYASGIILSSKKIFEDLNRHGCVEKKSMILEPPKNVPDELIRHFIRGYFDGDGFISNYVSHKRIEYKIGILGTEKFLNWINNVFSNNKISYRNIKIKNNIHLIQYNTKDKDYIFNYLYNDSTTFLNRKYTKFF
jgi:hypothetical protein